MAEAATAGAAAPDEPEAMELDSSQRLSLHLLEMIKLAQTQNGLKHGDYGRYRAYCTKRLKTLYKALKMTHGKKHYQKKKLEVKHIIDPRHLQVPLVSAERAWAYAMDIKNEMGNSVHRRKRRHLIKRLTKAAAWASELAAFSSERCDTRSALEAEAYAAWMQGNVLFEKETDWSGAMAQYAKAKTLFQELAKLGDLAQQGHCVQMVEEIDASLRFCDYEIRRQGGDVPDVRELLALSEQGQGAGQLQARLAALADEAQVQQAASTSEMEWRGRRVAVRHERVRVCLHQAGELQAQLAGSAGKVAAEERGIEARLAVLDRMINCYNEARGYVRNALKTGCGSAAEGEAEELQALEVAISGAILDRTVERSLAAVGDAEARFLGSLERAAQGKRLKDKERFAKPDDVVRLYDILLRNYEDLNDLAGRLGGRQGEQLITSCSAKVAECKAQRCFYVAHTLLAGGKFPEACGLFQRTIDRAAEAFSLHEEVGPQVDAAALKQLAALTDRAKTYSVVARAELALAFETDKAAVAGKVGSMVLGDAVEGAEKAATEEAKYLPDDLEAWESKAEGGEPRVFRYPGHLEAISVRPIMFDTAVTHLAYPDLSHRKTKTEKPSVLKSWLGWGRS